MYLRVLANATHACFGAKNLSSPRADTAHHLPSHQLSRISRVGQNHIYIYGVYTAFLAGKSPNIRSCTVHIYGSGQPYAFLISSHNAVAFTLEQTVRHKTY